eukprot:807100-Rhodomonas_salina.1
MREGGSRMRKREEGEGGEGDLAAVSDEGLDAVLPCQLPDLHQRVLAPRHLRVPPLPLTPWWASRRREGERERGREGGRGKEGRRKGGKGERERARSLARQTDRQTDRQTWLGGEGSHEQPLGSAAHESHRGHSALVSSQPEHAHLRPE